MRETKSNKAKRQRLQQPALSLVVCPEKDKDKRRCDDQVEPAYPPNWLASRYRTKRQVHVPLQTAEVPVLPSTGGWRQWAFEWAHDAPLAGHLNTSKTFDKLRGCVVWDRMLILGLGFRVV